MEGQLYVIQIDRCKQYPKNAEHYLQQGQFALHAGGRGNGAVGGLYLKHQINRIIGKYPEGSAKAIPVAPGYTFTDAVDNETEADMYQRLVAAGLEDLPIFTQVVEAMAAEGDTDE